MRKLAVFAIGTVAALFAAALAEQPVGRALLSVVAGSSALYLIVTAPGVRPRLPSVKWQRKPAALLFLRAERAGSRRLHRETLEAVASIHEHLQTAELASGYRRWNEFRAKSMGTSEEELSRLWREYTTAEEERIHAEGLENARKFGGRIDYLLSEHERRGLIEEEDVERLRWLVRNSNFFLTDVGTQLEGMAYKFLGHIKDA